MDMGICDACKDIECMLVAVRYGSKDAVEVSSCCVKHGCSLSACLANGYGRLVTAI
jgi:hypothetical protein